VVSRALPLIIDGMQATGVRRILVMSSLGVGETRDQSPFFLKLLHSLALRYTYADKVIAEQALRRTNLEWTLFYPATLTDGPTTAVYRVGNRLRLRGFPGSQGTTSQTLSSVRWRIAHSFGAPRSSRAENAISEIPGDRGDFRTMNGKRMEFESHALRLDAH
jgi:hypothetical protein